MSLFKILKGDSSRIDLETTPFHEGWCYFTPDDGGFYIDTIVGSTNKRIRINPPALAALTGSEDQVIGFDEDGNAVVVSLGDLAFKNQVSKTDLVSAVQTSLGKADSALQPGDVPEWAMADTKPSYTYSEVGADQSGAAAAVQANLDTHTSNKSNPHGVTAAQIGAATESYVDDAIEANAYTHPSSGVAAGTYRSVTVNAQGHVTAGSNPTTISGYGITDAYTKTQVDTAVAGAKSYADEQIAENAYSLPVATSSVLGGVKSGGDITVASDGTVSVNNNSHTHTASNITDLQAKLDAKVDAEDGKALSTNDYTDAEKNKLAGIAAGATANTGTITAVQANGTSVATSGVANIPAATTSKYGVTKLSSSTSSTSTSLAATASAVKSAYDLANTANTTANSAKASIDAFLADADVTTNAVDTLKEIQTYITEDGAAADALIARVGTNETNIAANTKSISDLSTTVSNNADEFDKHTHGVTVTGTNSTSTVTGSVTAPSVSRTQKYLSATVDAPGLTKTTDTVLGTGTKFSVSGGAASTNKTKLSAVVTDAAVAANGTAKAITGFGTHTTAAAITALNTTTIKNPSVTAVSIPNVTKSTDVSATQITSYGTLPSFSATVSDGKLTLGFNAGSKPTGTDVAASKVTLGTALSASKVSTSNVTVATGAKSTANAITALGTATTATALTGVKVSTQPTVTISSNSSTGDVEVVTGVSNGAITVTASGDNVTALTGVTAQAPSITLTEADSTSTGAVPVVSAVTIGSKSYTVSGTAAAQTWTQGSGATVTPQ